ncbi:MFP1 attachment factor 1, partial [Cucurbita argyrosperma subsp. argyrosperma]
MRFFKLPFMAVALLLLLLLSGDINGEANTNTNTVKLPSQATKDGNRQMKEQRRMRPFHVFMSSKRKRTRDAVISRLIETLSSPSMFSKRYGTIPADEAAFVALSIEEEAYAITNGFPATMDDGIDILQASTLSRSGSLEEKFQRGQYLLAVDCYGCASEDAGPEGEWMVRFHIDSREERVSQRWVDCEIPHRLERKTNILYEGVKTSS